MTQPRAAYVHIPFCRAKCGYCDFNSYAGMLGISDRYISALLRQIDSAGQGRPLETVYFGGGTPSILSADDLARVLRRLEERFGLVPGAEVTLEANPESAEPGKLTDLRNAGFNRISIGAQAFDDSLLERLGRVHSHTDFLEALANARAAGFENISFDLMYGLPGQTLKQWEQTLEAAGGLRAEHISAYCLTVEESTPFWGLEEQGLLQLPAEDEQVEMLMLAREMLTESGYEHYEISNFALAGHRCRHNEVYWRNEQYLGFGAGAVAYTGTERTKWEPEPLAFVEQVESSGAARVVERETLGARERMGETAMVALRTSDGLDIWRLEIDFGREMASGMLGTALRFVEAGVLEEREGRFRLTAAGIPVSNEVLREFL